MLDGLPLRLPHDREYSNQRVSCAFGGFECDSFEFQLLSTAIRNLVVIILLAINMGRVEKDKIHL